MKHLIGFVCAIGIIGCGSNPKQTKKAFDDSQLQYASARSKRNLSHAECPRGDKTWRRQSESKLLDIANACVEKQSWNVLDALGAHLAQLNPQSPWGVFYMSLASEGLGKKDKALWMIGLAVQKAPSIGFLHYQKGRILWGMSRFEESVTSMQQALEKDSALTDAHLFLGQLFYRDRDLRRAEKHFNKVLASEPGNVAALTGVAEAYYQAKNIDKAIIFFEKALDRSSSDKELRLRVAELYETQSRYGEALESYKRLQTLMKHKTQVGPMNVSRVKEKIASLEAIIAERNHLKKLTRSEASVEEVK